MRAVQWRDLTELNTAEVIRELTLSPPGWRFLVLGSSARQLRWVRAELAATFILLSAAWTVASPHAFRYHVTAMLVGQCLTAFFAVWTVHHDCDKYHFIARTVRNRVKSVMTLSMFFHVEHHLFPGVPTCHLDVIAQRLDAAAPELSRMRVF